MAGHRRQLTTRKLKLLAAVEVDSGLAAPELSMFSGLQTDFVHRALEELRAWSLVKSVSSQKTARRSWYSITTKSRQEG